MNKLQSRLKFYEGLIEHIYKNQEKILSEYNNLTETQFFTRPNLFLGTKYKKIGERLIEVLENMCWRSDGKKLTKNQIIECLLPK